MDLEILEVASRVLVCICMGKQTKESDERAIRSNALPTEKDCEIDDLAVRIIQRASTRRPVRPF